MPLMYQIPCRSHVSRLQSLQSAYSKSPRARESIVRSRTGDNPHTLSRVPRACLITASSGAARPLAKASTPRRLVPRTVFNTSKYTTTYGEGRTEDRAPRRYLNVTFACSVSLSTTIHEQHIPLAPAPPWPDPAAVPSLTTGRYRVRARLCALRRLWLHAGRLVHDFARAPRPCVALRGAQRAQERLRRDVRSPLYIAIEERSIVLSGGQVRGGLGDRDRG